MTELAPAQLTTAAAALVAALALSAAVALLALPDRRTARSVGVAATVAALAGIIVVVALAGTLDAARTVSAAAAAFGGAVVIAACIPRAVGTFARSVVAALGTALVVAPLAVVQLVAVPPLLETTLGAVDLGGAFPRLATPAAVVLGLLLAMPSSLTGATPVHRRVLDIAPIALATLFGVAAVGASVVAAEGNLNDETTRILVFAAIGAVFGAVGWMLVVRIAGRTVHAADPVAGAVVGAAAVALAAIALVPVAVVAAGAAAGLVGGAMRGARHPVRGLAAGVLAGLAAGGVVVALLAEGIGFAATGSLGQAAAQVGAVFVITVAGAAVGAALGAVARAAAAGARRAENDDSPGEPGL
ncbi:MAG: hypothetical protein ACXIUP_08855 [Microcella sp.]